MGSTDNQSNSKKIATKPDESTSVDSLSVSTEEDNSNQTSETTNDGSEGNENVEVEQAAKVSETDIQAKEVNSAPNVETVYLDDNKVGVRYDNYPLSTEVIKALDELGHRYLSRYQQSLLDILTLGEDRWFSINLASNRGVIIGAYLVDLAQTDLSRTTVVCV